MSRGLGKLQRRLLAAMRDSHWHDTAALAATVYGLRPHTTITARPTMAQLSGVRRALAGLVERGLAFRHGRQWTTSKQRWLADQVRQGHYLGTSFPKRPVHWFEHDGAIVVFAVPANRHLSSWLLGTPNCVVELARLWAPDGHRQNLLSQTLSRSIASLRQAHPGYEAVIAFADPRAGHHGGVYRAANFVALGQSEDRRYRVNGKRNHGQLAEGKLRFAFGLTRAAKRMIAAKME